MLCKICGVNETDNPDGIYDNCKVSIISNDDIPPNLWIHKQIGIVMSEIKTSSKIMEVFFVPDRRRN